MWTYAATAVLGNSRAAGMIAGEMISIAEALQLIRENTGSPSEVLLDLPESLGHTLTRDIHSDITCRNSVLLKLMLCAMKKL